MTEQHTPVYSWTDEEERTIDNMSLDTLVLLMEREGQANKGTLESDYNEVIL